MIRRLATALFVFFAAIAPAFAQVQDITPPTVSSYTLAPTTVDVRSTSQRMDLAINVADDLSGVNSVSLYLQSPSGRQSIGIGASPQPGGSRTGSEFRGSVYFNPSHENGTWKVYYVSISDIVGNSRAYGETNLPAGPSTITVISTLTTPTDTVPPVVTSLSLSATSADTSAAGQQINVTSTADDGVGGSGVSAVYAYFMLNNQFSRGVGMSPQPDGTFKGSIFFPRYSQAGTWKLYFMQVGDRAGNWRYYYSPSYCSSCQEQLPAQLQQDITIISDPTDILTPTIQSLEFTPGAIDVATASAQVTFTARVTDNLSGVGAIALYLYSPGFIQSRSVGLGQISGDNRDGIYRGTITFPQYSAAGIWSIHQVYLSDTLSNYRYLYTQDLLNAGFPAYLRVSSGLNVDNAEGDWGGSVSLRARLTSGADPAVGKPIQFSLRNVVVGSATTGADGVATLDNVSLAGIDGGTYVNGVKARFNGDSTLAAIENTANLTIRKQDQTIEFAPIEDRFIAQGGVTMSATTSSGLGVTYSIVSGPATISGSTVNPTGTGGTVTVKATQAGNGRYNPVSAEQSFEFLAQQVPSINWSTPAAIVYGTALSNAQLNATATANGSAVPGTFTYNPPAGTVLGANTHTLNVTFTPSNTSQFAGGSASVQIEVTRAQATLTLSGLAQTYDGSPKAAVVTVDPAVAGAASITYNGSATAPTNAGSYAVLATLNNANYAADDAAGTLEIAKATAIITVTGGTFTYDGLAHPATGSATGVDGTSLGALSFTYNGSSDAPSNAGSYAVEGSLPETTNHQAGSATATIIIDKAPATLSITPATVTYDGTPKALAVTVSPEVPGVSVTYNGSALAPSNAGEYAVLAKLTNDNYEAADASATLLINRATPSFLVTGGTFTYDGEGHPASGSVIGVNGTVLGVPSFTYNGSSSAPVTVGSYAVAAAFPGNDNYLPGADTTASITINRATPIITWDNPAGIVYGAALSNSQLNASASFLGGPLDGTLTYSPEIGTILNAGDRQTLSVSFQPSDTVNFSLATASVKINVAKADQSLTWSNPAGIMYGTVLGSGQLNATVSVSGPAPAGAVSYSPAAGTILHAGNGQTLTVSAAETANYHAAALSVTIDVARAPLTIRADNKTKIFGAPLPPLTASYSGFVAGDHSSTISGLTLSTAATQASVVGTYPIVAGGAVSGDYTITFIDGALTITPATTTISAGNVTGQYSDQVQLVAAVTPLAVEGQMPVGVVQFFIDGTPVGSSPLAAGSASVSVLLNRAPGSYGVKAVFQSTSGNFYGSTSSNATLVVTKEDARATYTGSEFVSTTSSTSGNAAVTLSATIQDISAVDSTDALPGDIRNATITFVNRDTNAVIGTAPIGLVTAGDRTTGTATMTWNVSIGNSDAETFTVGVVVNNYYTRDAAIDNVVVTVIRAGNESVAGGGYLVVKNSAGVAAASMDTKMNFGFNVKYNKSGKNVQGKINTILRRLEGDGRVHVYQIKGMAETLAVNTNTGKASFNGKANIQDITDPLAPISIEGNASLQVTLTDAGEPGTADTLAITLWNREGGLWFASQWDGAKTVEQALGGGNLQVR
jgi:hypothetical protein